MDAAAPSLIETYPNLEAVLSAERFGTYLSWADGNRSEAIKLYTLNVRLSECLYTPLHMLEVALRNRIHTVMCTVAGSKWYELPAYQLNSNQPEMLDRAKRELITGRKTISPSGIVAALTFGYWTSMLGLEYEKLWQTSLYQIGKRENGKGLRRKDFSGPLTQIRILRNRIAHHEPILAWNLRKHYGTMLQLTGWLSPVAALWCRDHCGFESIHPDEGATLAGRNG